MFSSRLYGTKKFLAKLWLNHLTVSCEEDIVPSLVQEADRLIEDDQLRIKTPIQFESVSKDMFQANSVSSYDGARVIVQKQLNMNTIATHFYWLGSQSTGQPIYQYRLIFPLDEGNKLINMATDMDLNIEGELKAVINKNLLSRAAFVVGEQQNNVSVDLEASDDSSSTQFKVSKGVDTSINLSYMQSLSPQLTLGGSGAYIFNRSAFETAFAGIYSKDDNKIAFLWDNSFRVILVKSVNPNRVQLATDLTIDANGQSQMAVMGEFTLKQSKLHMSIDSNLLIKSTVETAVMPGTQLQFNAEVCQLKDHYRFGYGIIMG